MVREPIRKNKFLTDRVSNAGSTLLFVLILLAFGSAGLGFVSLRFHWSRVVRTQLRLDRCITQTALELKNSLLKIERMNTQIRGLRLAIPPAMIKPPVANALKQTLQALVLLQEAELKRWNWSVRAQWTLRSGCDNRSDRAYPLPEQPWTRLPPDPIGPRVLEWPKSFEKKLKVRIFNGKRRSFAKVEKSDSTWRAGWSNLP